MAARRRSFALSLLAAVAFGCGAYQESAAPSAAARPRSEPIGPAEIRKACLAALDEIRKGLSDLVRKHPGSLAHLGPGTIDETTLTLEFLNTDPKHKTERDRRGGGKDGLRVRILFPGTGERDNFALYLPCSDAGVTWGWMWANRTFEPAAQDDFCELVTRSLAPVVELENRLVADDLAAHPKESHVFRGTPGIVATIRPTTTAAVKGSCAIDFFEENRAGTALAVGPGYCEVIVDGKIRPVRVGALRRGSLDKTPFVTLKPGARERVGTRYVGPLAPGRHRVQLILAHQDDGWMDLTPRYYDGAPEFRKVEDAWTGVVVSDEITIDVPE